MPVQGLSATTMAIVAHIDDDLLFMNPDIRQSIDAGNGHVTVFLTAGDAGRDEAYWEEREIGAKAAYTEMTGADDWVDAEVTLTDGEREFQVTVSYLESQPDVRLYFLRLPDGHGSGNGFDAYGNVSIEQLWEGEIAALEAVDGSGSYTSDDMVSVLTAIMDHHEPEVIMLQDHISQYTSMDHSDHIYGSLFAYEAQGIYGGASEVRSYIDYGTSNLPSNLSGADALATLEAFYAYAEHDVLISSSLDANGNPAISDKVFGWTTQQYYVDDVTSYTTLDNPGVWTQEFSVRNGDWDPQRDDRELADINGDGRADVVGVNDGAISIATSTGSSFNDAQTNPFNSPASEHLLGDVNGDGMDDLVGFAPGGVQVGLSNGTGFDPMSLWISGYSSANPNWDDRELADVNGDGMDDIIGFAQNGVQVSLSTGTGFAAAQMWAQDYSSQSGWDEEEHDRDVADVNGDGRADIVGFGENSVLVSTSNGNGFDEWEIWSTDFASDDGWSSSEHDRELADVNGDGLADIVAFGEDGVYVALSNGSGFEDPELWSTDFDENSGWDVNLHDRELKDVNGDGLDDIVGFGEAGTFVALSNGETFLNPAEYDGVVAGSSTTPTPSGGGFNPTTQPTGGSSAGTTPFAPGGWLFGDGPFGGLLDGLANVPTNGGGPIWTEILPPSFGATDGSEGSAGSGGFAGFGSWTGFTPTFGTQGEDSPQSPMPAWLTNGLPDFLQNQPGQSNGAQAPGSDFGWLGLGASPAQDNSEQAALDLMALLFVPPANEHEHAPIDPEEDDGQSLDFALI